MAENLFCSRCSMPAAVFGFAEPFAKVKVCREHIAALLDKRVSIFDIAAFRFIETPQDIPDYEERRRTAQKGLGQLDALESKCESDWTRNQQLMRTHSEQMFACVQRVYTEMWLRSQQRYHQIKQQLQTARNCLHQYMSDRYFCLSEATFDSTFNVGVEECRLSLARKLLSAFSLGPAVPTASADIDKELNLLLALSASEAEVSGTAKACEQVSAAASKLGDFSAAVAELQRGRSFLQQHNHSSLDLPLVCTLVQSQQYAAAVSVCQDMLRAERRPLEHLSALFYLALSLCDLKKHRKAARLLEKGQPAADSTESQCVLLYIQAHRMFLQGRGDDAAELYEQALQLGVLRTSYLTAASLDSLGHLYAAQGNETKAERQWLRSCAILSEHFPCSYLYCASLRHLGANYVGANRLDEAKETLAQAHALLSLHFPQSESMGLCSYSRGELYKKKGKRREARKRFETALPLLIQHGQQRIAAKAEKAIRRLDS